MKTLWIVYDKIQYGINEWFASRLLELFGECFDASIVMREDLPETFDRPDVAVVRTIDPSFSKKLELLGTAVINPPRVSEICNDKALSYKLAKEAGVPFSEIYDISGKKLPPKGVYPLVVKTASGHGGKGVRLCRSEDELKKAKKLLKGEKLVAQKLVGDGKSGRDLRVYVLGGRIFKAVLRSSDSDFRSNFSLGGEARPFDLGDNDREKVYKIVKALGEPDFIGVDFLVSGGELFFNEIEDVVGTRMLYAVYGIDAAKVFADYVKDKYGA